MQRVVVVVGVLAVGDRSIGVDSLSRNANGVTRVVEFKTEFILNSCSLKPCLPWIL